jgi:hypothetical protein
MEVNNGDGSGSVPCFPSLPCREASEASDIDLDVDLAARLAALPPPAPRRGILLILSSDDEEEGEDATEAAVPEKEEASESASEEQLGPIMVNGILFYDPRDERIKPIDRQTGKRRREQHTRENGNDESAALFNPIRPLQSYVESARDARRSAELRQAMKALRGHCAPPNSRKPASTTKKKK